MLGKKRIQEAESMKIYQLKWIASNLIFFNSIVHSLSLRVLDLI